MTNQSQADYIEDIKTHVTFYYENGKTFTARDIVVEDFEHRLFTTFTYATFKTQNNINSKTAFTVKLNDVLAVVIFSGNTKTIIKRPSKKVYVNLDIGISKKVIVVEKPVVQKTKLKRKPVEPVVEVPKAKVKAPKKSVK
jgi:hypothetical protein